MIHSTVRKAGLWLLLFPVASIRSATWPGEAWGSAAPAEAGLDAVGLAAARDRFVYVRRRRVARARGFP